jgi:hypothetical protein
VCEHVQETGDSCDVCGKELTAPAPVKVQVPLLPDLEESRWEEPFPEDPAMIPELELTSLSPSGSEEVASDSISEFEPTANAPVDVSATPMDEMDMGRAFDTDAPTPARVPGPVTCRYCQNVQTEGSFCDRCGMRLARGTMPPGVIKTVVIDSGVLKSCRRCGEKVMPGTRCKGCGMTAPESDDL